MNFIASWGADLAGKLGEVATPKDTGSPEFRLRQSIREYNVLLDRTDPTEPAGSPSMKCVTSKKAERRKKRRELIRKTQNNAALENSPARKKQLLATANRFAEDMDRVEDAKLSLHAYTANEDPTKQAGFMKPLRDQPPPGFKTVSLDQVAADFGVDRKELEGYLRNPDCPSQKIMIYERDTEVLGPGPKYTVAFRGSTSDERDWNNNGRNEFGFEAPHQKNAARLGNFLKAGADKSGIQIDDILSVTGHSKGGSEAQAFAATSKCSARVYNPAGFNTKQYEETAGVEPEQMRIDRTTIVSRSEDGTVIPSTKELAKTDPLFYAQHYGLSAFVMKTPITNGAPRELAPIDPNLSVPCTEQSDSEAHSMLQVIEALERDKASDEKALQEYSDSRPY